MVSALLLCCLAVPPTASADHGLADLGSLGQINGNAAIDVEQEVALSTDGTVLVFSTSERLVSADTDNAVDVYQRAGGVTSLVSAGETNGNGPFDASFNLLAPNGARVFFRTQEQLVSADTDTAFDLYERSGGNTILVSVGTASDCLFCNAALGSSTDGTRVFFTTDEQLAGGDTDAQFDVYERSAGVTTRVSAGEINGNGTQDAPFIGASSDGTKVFFQTAEQLVSADTAGGDDVYERSGGTTTLVSATESGVGGGTIAGGGTPSTDGTRFFFLTGTPMVSADMDIASDVYERFSGTTTLVSTGPAGGNGPFSITGVFGASADGARFFFETAEKLVSADTDGARDVYERSGGVTTRVSAGQVNGNLAHDAILRAWSIDGTAVFFRTGEQLVSADSDSSMDIYQREGGTTTLVSTGAVGGNGPFDVGAFITASSDGERVFFRTQEKLASADTDASFDVYERFGGTTTLISRGQQGGNGPFDATLLFTESGLTPPLTGRRTPVFTTSERLACADTDSARDVYVARIGSGPSLGCPVVSGPPPAAPFVPPTPGPSDGGLRDLVLCGRRDISLVRADPSGRRVIVSGLVSTRLQGTPITIHGTYGGKTRKLATVRAKADGSFQTRVKGPTRRQFAKARLQARAGSTRSVRLKLPQSLASSSIRASGGTITLKGKVQRGLVGKRNKVTIKRLLCGRLETVGSAKPSRSGAYTVRFKAPAGATAALYRAEARVRSKPRSKRYVKQFARAIGITLTGQTG